MLKSSAGSWELFCEVLVLLAGNLAVAGEGRYDTSVQGHGGLWWCCAAGQVRQGTPMSEISPQAAMSQEMLLRQIEQS
jgi:hypothetical protein